MKMWDFSKVKDVYVGDINMYGSAEITGRTLTNSMWMHDYAIAKDVEAKTLVMEDHSDITGPIEITHYIDDRRDPAFKRIHQLNILG